LVCPAELFRQDGYFDKDDFNKGPFDKEKDMALTKLCFCMCPNPADLSPASQAAVLGRKAALLKEAFWGPHPIITVGFLEGDPALCKRVAEAAKLWITEAGAKVTFAFLTDPSVDPKTADVRIAFKPGNGSWSYLGTQCKTIARDKSTMNFGWLDANSSDEDVRSVVLHEFGHALGLIHEHQNPKDGINWDRAAVEAELSGPPNNWDMATIEHNIFKKYDKDAVIATGVDKTSIMMYQIPANWTQDGFTTSFNATLSPQDKTLIQSIYF
jgi:serralysin